MVVNSTVLIALVLLFGATVASFAEEAPKQTFTRTAKLLTSALWKRRAALGNG